MSTQEIATRAETSIEQAAGNRLSEFLKHWGKGIQKVLPKHLNEERVVQLLVNNVRRTPDLLSTSPASFVNSVLQAANLGLEIRTNSAYLIPFGKECTLIIDYRGKMELARRAGCGAIDVQLVREWDEFTYGFGVAGREFSHKPLLFRKGDDGRMIPVDADERGEYVLGYAAAQLPQGRDWQLAIMTRSEIEAIRRRARGGKGEWSLEQIRNCDIDSVPYKQRTPWLTDYDQMACKTLIHRLCKGLPQTAELVLSQQIDDAVDTGATMPLAAQLESLVIDPEFEQPMLPTGTCEDQQKVAAEKIEKLSGGRKAPAKATITEEQIEELRRRLRDVPEEESDRWLIWCKAKTLRDLDQAGYALFCAEIEKRNKGE